MIKNIIIIALFLPLLTFAQKEILTYDQTQDIEFSKQYKNNTAIHSYITKEGITISVGDTLVIGNAIIKTKKYLFHDVFSHVIIGNPKGETNKTFRYLPHKYSGNKVIIKSLFVTHEKFTGLKFWTSSKKMPLYVSSFIKEYKSGIFKKISQSRKTILDIEKALSSGEIINPNAPLLMQQKINKLVDLEDEGKYDLLLKLGKLKESGVLTEKEFQEEKKKILERK